MLNGLRIWPRIRDRFLASPLGPHADGFVRWLQDAGYSQLGTRRHLQAADRFGNWLAGEGITSERVDERVLERFIRGLRRTPSPRYRHGRLSAIAIGARRMAEFLWEKGIAKRCLGEESGATSNWLRSFDEHLRRVQGLAGGTRARYLRYARRFVDVKFGDDEPDWPQVTADDVVEFVRAQAGRLKPSSCRGPVTATRAMLRFLAVTGAVAQGLVDGVPTVRQWKHAALPRYLDDEQLERVLRQHSGTTSVVELRRHAVLLLLARLGLRASEVARLTVDDLEWREGRIRVRAGKSARERCLPLSAEVGEALAAYLSCRGHVDGRRSLFFLARPPNHRPLTAGAVTGIAQRALQSAGVEIAKPGAHVFRHTAATQMVRRGAAFKDVADILGHALIETTTIYAKLDVDSLACIPLPWPGDAR